MKTVLIGIARMGSTRFPGKVLKDLGGLSVLGWVVRAGRAAKLVDEVWIATSTLPADDAIEYWCENNNIKCFRGSEADVLSRFAGCARAAEADVVIRVTCDCPFIDPNVIDTLIKLRDTTRVDYASNIYPPTWPDGLDCEVFTVEALYTAELKSTRPVDRECVTTFITRNRDRFRAINYSCPLPNMSKERWVLDTEDDFKLCTAIAQQFKDSPPSYLDIFSFLESNPSLRSINSHEMRNSRLYEGLSTEKYHGREFNKSAKFFETASTIIPFGAQTFSKSYLAFGKDGPLFLTHGLGGRCNDIDGNDYVDLVGALLPNILGYCDPDVDWAIRQQLDSGISFSLATKLESVVASKLIKHIPCAQMVKFGKSGSDAISACVRLARAYTGRNKVLVCSGYSGWHDWAVHGTEKNFGSFEMPDVIRVPYGDIKTASLKFNQVASVSPLLPYDQLLEIEKKLKKDWIAAIVVEPEIPGLEDNYTYLQQLHHLCKHYGALLIFDEVITGFRWGMAGGQGYWGVTPDLAAFGKSMANGMPISAVVGRADVMERCAPSGKPNIFYSGTYFGEALSLTAAKVCIDKLDHEKVPDSLWRKSEYLIDGIIDLQTKYGLEDVVQFGHGPLYRVTFNKKELGFKFTHLMAKAGVLIHASHNLCHAHTQHDLNQVLNAYDYALKGIKDEH